MEKMDAFTSIKLQLSSSNLEDIAKKLGYKSTDKGIKSIEAFINAKNLYFWFKKGFYDFKYDSFKLFQALAKIFNISNKEIADALEEERVFSKEYESYKNSYIFANTNFRRKNEPIFALAFLEQKRRFFIKKEYLLFKSDEEVFEIISKIVRRHFKITKGKLVVWGDIQSYQYHHKDGEIYVFDTNGNLVQDKPSFENEAVLQLR
jgi:hypothetical protein